MMSSLILTARARLTAALDILEASRHRVWRRLPYFTVLLWRLKPVERAGTVGMAVDDGLRLYYDETQIAAWGVEYTPTFLAHEVQHIVRRHHKRAKALETWLRARYERVAAILRQTKGIASFHMLCNYGGDLEINDALGHDWPWPPNFVPLRPELHGLPADLSMEEYCARLVEEAERALTEQEAKDEAEAERGPEDESDAGGDPAGDHEPDAHAGGESKGESDADGDAGEEEAEAGPDGEGAGEEESSGEEEAGADAPDPDEDTPDGDREHPCDGGDPEADQRADDAGPESLDDAAEDDGGDDGDGGGEPHAGSVATGCCGSCAGNAAPGEGVGDDLPDATTTDEREVLDRRVAEAVVNYKASNSSGIAPGGWLLQWAQAQLAPPKLNPYKVLARAVRGTIASTRSRLDWKMGPPSTRREVLRRMPQWGDRAPILPVLRGPVPRVLVIIDASGSMGRGAGSDLEKAARETVGMIRIGGGDCYAMAVDAKVQSVQRVRRAEDVLAMLKGGGGTNMAVGVRAAAEQDPPPDVIVLITDGRAPGWPTQEEMPKRTGFVTVVVSERRSDFDGVPEHLKRDAVWINE